jgi:hypothetical protein
MLLLWLVSDLSPAMYPIRNPVVDAAAAAGQQHRHINQAAV